MSEELEVSNDYAPRVYAPIELYDGEVFCEQLAQDEKYYIVLDSTSLESMCEVSKEFYDAWVKEFKDTIETTIAENMKKLGEQ